MVLRSVRPRRLVLGALAVVTLAMATAVAIALWAATGPAAGVRVYQAPPAGAAGEMARQYALGLLAKLTLPGGTRPAAWPAEPDRLPQLMLPYWPTDAVTAQALYRAGASMGSVDWFLLGHVPAGMRPREAYPANGTDRFVLDVPARLPPGIAHANLAVVIIPRGSGSLIRAEVQVVWYPPRSAVEYIHPGRYRSVTVTVPVLSDASGHATVTRAFAARAVITQLASLLNRLPGMLPTAFNCPAMTVPPITVLTPYRVVFTPRSGRWPTITATPVGCFQGGVVVGKHRQPALDFSRDKIIPVMLSLMGQDAQPESK
jgi:hypothetical protein